MFFEVRKKTAPEIPSVTNKSTKKNPLDDNMKLFQHYRIVKSNNYSFIIKKIKSSSPLRIILNYYQFGKV